MDNTVWVIFFCESGEKPALVNIYRTFEGAEEACRTMGNEWAPLPNPYVIIPEEIQP